MRRKLSWVVLLGAAISVTAPYHARKVHATPAQGFVGTTIAQGRFSEIDVFNQLIPPANKGDIWLSWQKTKGSSDLFVQSNVWQPGEARAGTHTRDIA